MKDYKYPEEMRRDARERVLRTNVGRAFQPVDRRQKTEDPPSSRDYGAASRDRRADDGKRRS